MKMTYGGAIWRVGHEFLTLQSPKCGLVHCHLFRHTRSAAGSPAVSNSWWVLLLIVCRLLQGPGYPSGGSSPNLLVHLPEGMPAVLVFLLRAQGCLISRKISSLFVQGGRIRIPSWMQFFNRKYSKIIT